MLQSYILHWVSNIIRLMPLKQFAAILEFRGRSHRCWRYKISSKIHVVIITGKSIFSFRRDITHQFAFLTLKLATYHVGYKHLRGCGEKQWKCRSYFLVSFWKGVCCEYLDEVTFVSTFFFFFFHSQEAFKTAWPPVEGNTHSTKVDLFTHVGGDLPV